MALALVDRFFQAYVRTDLDTLGDMLCERDERLSRVLTFIQESQAPMSPFRVETYQVRSAAPVWIGRQPYFRVEVSFPRRRSPGQILHVYQVKAKIGCIDGFLDLEPSGINPMAPNASVPSAPPNEAPGSSAPFAPDALRAPLGEPPATEVEPVHPAVSDDEIIEL